MIIPMMVVMMMMVVVVMVVVVVVMMMMTTTMVMIMMMIMMQAYRARSLEYGPVYKEQLGPVQMVVISDPKEYSKVMRAEGKFPNRREMEPMAYYRQQKGLDLGLVNS